MEIRTEQIRFGCKTPIRHACHLANNLYNEANYVVRQYFFTTGHWIPYTTLHWLLKDVKQSSNYKNLPAQTAQQLLRLVDKNWKSFFHALKDWKKHPQNYLGRPKPPKYRKKNGEFLLLFTNQQVRLKNGWLHLPKQLLTIRTRITQPLKGARILPQGTGYLLEILYERPATPLKPAQNRMASIDLGLDNLITIVNNIGEQPIVINGKSLKALNQYFNKRKSSLQRIYAKAGITTGKKQRILTQKRHQQLKDRLHKVSRYVVNYCRHHTIDTLVVGYNPKWKQKINIGKRNNQHFVNIPFYLLIQQLEYKCQDAGIHFILTNESYTSNVRFWIRSHWKNAKRTKENGLSAGCLNRPMAR